MSHARCLLLLFTLILSTRLVAAEEVRKATAEGLTTKVFKLPFNFNGFSQLGDPPPAPPQPSADPFAPAPVLDDPQPLFKTSRKILEECGVTFPAGASSVFDPVTRELTLHNTPEMHELTQAYIDTIAWDGNTPTIASTLTVVEGPGALIREANAAASRDADATPQLDELLAAAARQGSGVRVVGETLIDLRSGIRGTVEAVRERPQVLGFKKKTTTVPPATGTGMGGPAGADQEPEPEIGRVRQDGLRLELESQLGADGKTLDTTLSVDLGPEGAAEQSEGAPTLASPPAAEGLRKASFRTGVSSIGVSTKLIGITQPTGAATKKGPEEKADADILWAVFLSSQVRRVEPPPCAIAPPGLQQEKLPAGLRAAAFRVPEGLLEPLIPSPFDYRDAPLSLRTWLATQGVSFPTGASIEHRGGLLQVVSTPEDIEIIAALVEQAWGEAPHSLAFTLHTYQVPASLLRQLRREAPAHADDTTLQAGIESTMKGGKATLISSTFFQGKPGIRGIHESGRRHGYLAQFGTTDATSQARLAFQEEIVGSFMEVEPIVSADGRTLSLNYRHELHPAPPTGQRQRLRLEGEEKDRYHDLPAADFHVLRSIAGTSMASGGTKLISLHSPALPGHAEGNDMLWATFLQAHVVPQVEKPQPPKKEPKSSAQDEANAASPGAHLTEKMNKIIFPSVTFQATPVDKALEYLSAKSRDYDTSTKDNSEKGVSIVLRLGDAPGDAPVTLDLKDVPMSEALRYVTELSQMAYTVEEHAVLVRPSYQVNAHLHTRSFRVPPDFMSIGVTDPDAVLPADPFAPIPPKRTKAGRKVKHTAKQILEAQGISFPEGASASFISTTSMLVVHNTQPNLDIVEAFCSSPGSPRPVVTVAITAQVLQGPGPLLRRIAAQAAPLNDHRAMLDELLAAVKAGTVQPLDTARIEAKYGIRAVAEQGHERSILTGITLAEKDGGSPKLQHSASNIGLRLEAEPLIGADGFTIELTLAAEFHTAPPVERAEHLMDAHGHRTGFTLTDTHLAKIVTATTLPDGHARLLHLCKPTGNPELEKEDVLQVIFITADILRGPQE